MCCLDKSGNAIRPEFAKACWEKTLGISKPTMYDLVHKGVIPSITMGRKILISRKALSDWLENGGKHGKEAC